MLDAVSGGRAFPRTREGCVARPSSALEEERPLAGSARRVAIVGRCSRATRPASPASASRSSPGSALVVSAAAHCAFRSSIGTWGPATARWAGTVADELKLGGSANPDFVPVVRAAGSTTRM